MHTIDKEMIDRINALAKKQKSTGLNDAELAEQKQLRKEYLKAFKTGMKRQLESVKVIDPQGKDVTPKRK